MPLKGFKHRWLVSMECLSDKTFVTPQCDFWCPCTPLTPPPVADGASSSQQVASNLPQRFGSKWLRTVFLRWFLSMGVTKVFIKKHLMGAKPPTVQVVTLAARQPNLRPSATPLFAACLAPCGAEDGDRWGQGAPNGPFCCLCLPNGPIRVLHRPLSSSNPWSPVAEYIFTRH